MSDSSIFWFHCGRCGSLFQSQPGDLENRLCTKCGFDPSTGVLDATAESEPARHPQAAATAESASRPEKHSVRRRKNRHLMAKLVAGWSLVLALIIFGAKTLWPEHAPPSHQHTSDSSDSKTISDLDIKLLEEAGPRCIETFSQFLAAITPEERNQFVLSPVSTASRMVRFYSLNPLTNIDPSTISLERNAVLDLGGGKAIETLWAGPEGKRYDALFREENGEWRLDWEHFARYSDFPWSQFLAGDGPNDGEFRLLARERLAKERKNEENLSIVLYAPRFGRPEESGFQSPEFLVPRSDPAGRLLDAAFQLARDGKRVFGSTLPHIDPDGMIRVRVKVKRTEVNLERKFEITAVTACHWFSTDDPGVKPASDAAPK